MGPTGKALAPGVLGTHGQPGDRATLQLRAGPGPRLGPSQVISRRQVMQLDFKIYKVKEVTESNQQQQPPVTLRTNCSATATQGTYCQLALILPLGSY